MKKSSGFILVVLIFSIARPAGAVREGWRNGKILPDQFERKGQWQKAAKDEQGIQLERCASKATSTAFFNTTRMPWSSLGGWRAGGWWQGTHWCVMIHRGNREAALGTVADETA